MRILLIAALVVSSVSFAQTSGAKPRAQPKTEVRFDDGEEVEGGTTGPLGTHIDVRPPSKFGTMIRVRENFADKLKASVHDLH